MTVLRIRAEPLTADAFRSFGIVMETPKGGNRVGPMPVIADPRPTAKVMATLIDLLAQSPPRQVRQIERHLNSAQFFLHLSGGSLSLVVFPAKGDGLPDINAAQAFVAAPGQAFGYHPGTWHAGVAALDATAQVASLLSRDGTAGDVDERLLAETIEVDCT